LTVLQPYRVEKLTQIHKIPAMLDDGKSYPEKRGVGRRNDHDRTKVEKKNEKNILKLFKYITL